MKKIFLMTLISSSFLLTTPHQSIAGEPLPKEQIAELYGEAYSINHLDEITFHELFPRAFYQKSYFSGVVLATTVVAAGTFSYLTAGVGAPAAATGVSALASTIGGGGAGSYMAGLSAVGSWFGGNAMLGGAILNGISIGVGGGAAASSLTLASKVATVTTFGLTGIAFLPGKGGSTGKYVFDLRIPERELGSGSLRKVTENLFEIQDDLNDALESDDKEKITVLMNSREDLYKKSLNMLKDELKKPALYNLTNSIYTLNDLISKSYLFQSPENLIILSVIAYRSGDYDLFQKGIEAARKNLSPFEVGMNDGYLDYLEGISELMKDNPDLSYARSKFYSSWNQEPYVLEPIIAIITIMGEEVKNNRVKLAEVAGLTDKAVDQFDSDKYNPRVNETGLYFNAATIYFKAKDYSSALKYYKEAEDSIGFIAKYMPGESSVDMVNNIRVMEAICLFNLNKGDEAAELFNDIMEDYEDSPEKAERFKAIYQEG